MKMERTWYTDFRLFLIVIYGLVQVTAIELGMRFDILGTVDEASKKIGGQVNLLFIGGCLIVVVIIVLLLLIRYGLSRIFYTLLDYGLLLVAVAVILLCLGQPWYVIVPVYSLAAVLQYTVRQFHNVSTGILAVGLAAALGSYFEAIYVIALFAFFMLLDILSSRYTGHIRKIVEDMLSSRHTGHIRKIVEDMLSLLYTRHSPKKAEKTPEKGKKGSILMFDVGTSLVGCADIAFPCMLAVSAFTHSLEVGGVLASVFGLIGLLLAARHDEVHALPYVSLGILGLFIGYLVQHPECIDVLRTVTF
jgi:presenilin-like A22 family membrane protease